jgi:tetratricopeptide (TPR) repeat protein
MKMAVNLLVVCLAVGAACLAAWSYDRSQPPKKQQLIKQTAGANQSPSLPVPLAETNDLKNLEARANNGDASAQFDLGVRCGKGDGVPVDHEKAAVWYRKAAEQGLAKAQAALGRCYAIGEGVAQDYAEAAKWSRKAAEQGDARGQLNLGFSFANGQGVPQDYAEAVKWYRKAAEQGLAMAQSNLGKSFASGQGVPQDYVEAYKWCNLVLAQAKPADLLFCNGFIDTPPRVPFVTFNGTSIECGRSALVTTPIGPVKVTFVRMEKASAQILIEGEAQTKTLVQVQNSAAAKPFQGAFTLRKFLERQMTRNQIAEGQNRASVFGT